MKIGPLAETAARLKDRIRTAPAQRRLELARTWVIRAYRVNLPLALEQRADRRTANVFRALGPIGDEQDAARISAMIGELASSIAEPWPRAPLDRARATKLGVHLALSLAHSIIARLTPSITVEDLLNISHNSLMLADSAKVYGEEMEAQLREVGGAADG